MLRWASAVGGLRLRRPIPENGLRGREVGLVSGWAVARLETVARRSCQDWIELDRKPAKNFNFGMIFGMGDDKLIRSLGVSRQEGERLHKAYHAGLPFAKQTYDLARQLADRRGYIRTILGRRSRFPLWESRDWDESKRDGPMRREDAVERYGTRGIRRAGTFKALNHVLQLTAADIIKKAMVDIWDAGICDVVGAPLVQVHDELDWSDPGAPEAFAEARRIMETCVQIKVPLVVDTETGPNWGACG